MGSYIESIVMLSESATLFLCEMEGANTIPITQAWPSLGVMDLCKYVM